MPSPAQTTRRRSACLVQIDRSPVGARSPWTHRARQTPARPIIRSLQLSAAGVEPAARARVAAAGPLHHSAALAAGRAQLEALELRRHRRWLVGEGLAILIAMIPAQLLARWTMRHQMLGVRAAMQAAVFSMLMLWVLPDVIFQHTSRDWSHILSSWHLLGGLPLQLSLLPALFGMSGVQEFAERGGGMVRTLCNNSSEAVQRIARRNLSASLCARSPSVARLNCVGGKAVAKDSDC